MLERERVEGFDQVVKDRPSVTPSGERLQELIDGVRLRPARTHADHRGELCEIFDERWDFTDDPVPKYRVPIDSEVVPYRM